MELEKIKSLRKRIYAPITECSEALKKTNGDIEKAFQIIKEVKIAEIVSKTGISKDKAFLLYQQYNGDIDKAISNVDFTRIIEKVLSISGETKTKVFKENKECEIYKSNNCIFTNEFKNKNEFVISIMNFLTNDYENIDIFEFFIEGIKRNPKIIDFCYNEVIDLLMVLYIDKRDDQWKNNLYLKGKIIGLIINSFNSQELEIIKEIFDEYINIISNDDVYIEMDEIIECISSFKKYLSIDYIFSKIADNLNDADIINIFMIIGIKGLDFVQKKHILIMKKCKKSYRLKRRSHEIAIFLSIVNEKIKFNLNTSSIKMSYINSFEGACLDWNWGMKDLNGVYHDAKCLVDEKVLFLEDSIIFNKLGELITKKSSHEDIYKLYKEFFKEKDVFEYIYSLP